MAFFMFFLKAHLFLHSETGMCLCMCECEGQFHSYDIWNTKLAIYSGIVHCYLLSFIQNLACSLRRISLKGIMWNSFSGVLSSKEITVFPGI